MKRAMLLLASLVTLVAMWVALVFVLGAFVRSVVEVFCLGYGCK